MANRTRVVLDASALLAAIYFEPGADRVAAVLDDAVLSAVNLSEVVGKLRDAGWTGTELVEALDLPMRIVAFDESMAHRAAGLLTATRSMGLSLGDRACLATALALNIETVLTADAVWQRLGIDRLQVSLIR